MKEETRREKDFQEEESHCTYSRRKAKKAKKETKKIKKKTKKNK
jgi:hypothetical protein